MSSIGQLSLTPFAATGGTGVVDLADRFVGLLTPDDFKLASETTYDNAFARIRTLAEASDGLHLHLQAKAYEVTGEIDWTDLTAPIKVTGAGYFLSVVWRNWSLACAGEGVFNISFTADANRINGIELRNFCVAARGILGDPIAVKALAMQDAVIDVTVPGDGGQTIAGVSVAHMNTAILATKVNNSYIYGNLLSGYQPIAFNIASASRFSGSAASATLTQTQNTGTAAFAAGMVGETIFLQDGGGAVTYQNKRNFWQTTIDAVAGDGLSCTLHEALRADVTDTRISVGQITGSISASGTTLTLDYAVADAAMVGMLVVVPLARDVTNPTTLVTTVATYTDTTHLELADAADNTVTSGPVVFAPVLFVGELASEESDSRTTNDVTIRIRGDNQQSVGVLLSNTSNVKIHDTKLEGEVSSNVFSRSIGPMIVGHSRDILMTNVEFDYGWNDRAPLWVMGDCGLISIVNGKQYGQIRDVPQVLIDTGSFVGTHVHLGQFFMQDGLKSYQYDWQPVSAPIPTMVSYANVVERYGQRAWGRKWSYEFATQRDATPFSSTTETDIAVVPLPRWFLNDQIKINAIVSKSITSANSHTWRVSFRPLGGGARNQMQNVVLTTGILTQFTCRMFNALTSNATGVPPWNLTQVSNTNMAAAQGGWGQSTTAVVNTASRQTHEAGTEIAITCQLDAAAVAAGETAFLEALSVELVEGR